MNRFQGDYEMTAYASLRTPPCTEPRTFSQGASSSEAPPFFFLFFSHPVVSLVFIVFPQFHCQILFLLTRTEHGTRADTKGPEDQRGVDDC
ncbi:unnamed protein product [Chondrus crispus]|uniref:Uncharacterized protein n=1 Tax=Chondrus crispus TaxID=2769 RepID=R7QKS0_CHOCR|nr:unnamed protein product [Chondrus crispus]CDF39117.1 unnamed protein product [Chondrus crispus]|eukprot:XP_005719028.1 unnamed protein product [Chondrus crispus]